MWGEGFIVNIADRSIVANAIARNLNPLEWIVPDRLRHEEIFKYSSISFCMNEFDLEYYIKLVERLERHYNHGFSEMIENMLEERLQVSYRVFDKYDRSKDFMFLWENCKNPYNKATAFSAAMRIGCGVHPSDYLHKLVNETNNTNTGITNTATGIWGILMLSQDPTLFMLNHEGMWDILSLDVIEDLVITQPALQVGTMLVEFLANSYDYCDNAYHRSKIIDILAELPMTSKYPFIVDYIHKVENHDTFLLSREVSNTYEFEDVYYRYLDRIVYRHEDIKKKKSFNEVVKRRWINVRLNYN